MLNARCMSIVEKQNEWREQNKMLYPNPIHEGATIAVISPASTPLEERVKRGVNYLQARGFKVVMGKHVLNKNKYLSGQGAEQLTDLHAAFANPEVDASICSRGGYGTPRYLNALDFELIKENPKPLVGYSDITALQCALLTQADLVSFSGPMVAVEMGSEEGIDSYTEKMFWDLVSKPLSGQRLQNPAETDWAVLSEGTCEGQLIGGCLALFNNLMGTRFFPEVKGNILVLEDIGENVQHIDRMLTQFKQAGFFDTGGLAGLMLGQFIDAWDKAEEDDFTLEELVRDIIGNDSLPIVSNVAYGHGPRKMSLPLGAHVRLDTDSQTLAIL